MLGGAWRLRPLPSAAHCHPLPDVYPAVGQAAASLVDQTKQMEGILDDLDDIQFNMKKAQKVIAEITRGLITDK